MKLSASEWPAERVRAWTTALETLATAGEAAVAATGKRDLMASTADALAGAFADWVIVDLAPAGQGSRSVAGRLSRPELAAAVAQLPIGDCPLTISAMDQRTPLVQAEIADTSELGILPDGQRVADALGAGSYAVSPITACGRALGAITIVRNRSRPPVTFVELNVLAHIADLAAAAIERLDSRGELVHASQTGGSHDGPDPPRPLA
ncbi:MAG: GAF domain-containing protein [Streptosporangiaceae bacterium]